MSLHTELLERKGEIFEIAIRHGARTIRIFGSVARGEEQPGSDIDFLVDFPRGYDLFTQRLPLAEHLAHLFQHPVDVVPEHELNQHMREQVLREAVDP